MKRTVLLVVLMYSNLLYCQVEIEWQKCYGAGSPDEATGITQTYDGGFIVTGSTRSSGSMCSVNHGNGDCFVMKIDSIGNIQWTRCMGGTLSDNAHDIIQTADSGYVLVGMSESNNCDLTINKGSKDVWIVRMSPSGLVLWQKSIGGEHVDIAWSVIESNDGTLIVAGNTISQTGDIPGNHGSSDAFVIKLDFDGNVIWSKCYGGSDFDGARTVRQLQDGNYLITGYASSNDGDVNGVSDYSDIWLFLIDSAGTFLGQRCYSGYFADEAYSMDTTCDGGFIIAGYAGSNAGDAFVIKTDSVGTPNWYRLLGGNSEEVAFSVMTDDDKSVIVAGVTLSSYFENSINSECKGIFLTNLDYQGNRKWNRFFGGSQSEMVWDVKRTNDYGIVIAGSTSSNNGDVTLNHGNFDIWIIKLKESNLKGLLFYDSNQNGIKDVSENGVSGQLLRIDPDNHFIVTDSLGKFYYRKDSGCFSVNYIPQPYWVSTTTGLNSYCVTSSYQSIDTIHLGVFAMPNFHDVSAILTGIETRPGFNTSFWLTCKNVGTETSSGSMEFTYDSVLTYISSTESPMSHAANVLKFDYNALSPGTQITIRIDFTVSQYAVLSDSIESLFRLIPIANDTNITNNSDTLMQVITGSCDPNDKLVDPSGYLNEGYVRLDQRLTYTVRFQNTGTDTAFNIVIRDTIDHNLDLETISFEASSHPAAWQLNDGNEMVVKFENIRLPDESHNESESHGFIKFSISPKQGIIDNTKAYNTAYIFFDYNPSIVTNTTTNTFVTNVPYSIHSENVNSGLVLHPNPCSDQVYINSPFLPVDVMVINAQGETVQTLFNQYDLIKINTSNYNLGLYMVVIKHGSGVFTTSFVKE